MLNISSWKTNGKKNAIYGEMAIILRRFKFFPWINKEIGKNAIYREIAINLEDLRIEVYFMNK